MAHGHGARVRLSLHVHVCVYVHLTDSVLRDRILSGLRMACGEEAASAGAFPALQAHDATRGVR